MREQLSPAVAIGHAVLSALRDVVPSNDLPRWVDLSAEAKRRGMSTTALRAWCMKHKIEIREDSHRRAWVSPQAIDAAIEGLPVATKAQPKRDKTEDDAMDQDINEQSQRRKGK